MAKKTISAVYRSLSVPFIALIVLYQRVLSRDTGFLPQVLGFSKATCMFYPTCSEYMKQSIEKYGLFKGIGIGTKRIVRCRPSSTPGVDLVP